MKLVYKYLMTRKDVEGKEVETVVTSKVMKDAYISEGFVSMPGSIDIKTKEFKAIDPKTSKDTLYRILEGQGIQVTNKILSMKQSELIQLI